MSVPPPSPCLGLLCQAVEHGGAGKPGCVQGTHDARWGWGWGGWQVPGGQGVGGTMWGWGAGDAYKGGRGLGGTPRSPAISCLRACLLSTHSPPSRAAPTYCMQCGTWPPAPTSPPTTLPRPAPTAPRACGAPTACSRCACLWVSSRCGGACGSGGKAGRVAVAGKPGVWQRQESRACGSGRQASGAGGVLVAQQQRAGVVRLAPCTHPSPPPPPPSAGHTSDVDVVRWHPNCHYIATGSTDRTGR